MCNNLCLCPQNLLCLDIAKELGVDIPDPFFTWTAGAALPSLVGLVGTPLLLYNLMRPEVRAEGPERGTLPSRTRGDLPLNKMEPALALPLSIVRSLPTHCIPTARIPVCAPSGDRDTRGT